MGTQTIKVESLRSLYVVPALGDRPLASATGFVVVNDGVPYLITNWHVVATPAPENRSTSSWRSHRIGYTSSTA